MELGSDLPAACPSRGRTSSVFDARCGVVWSGSYIASMPASAAPFQLSVSLDDYSFSASGKPDQVLKAFEDFKAMAGYGGEGSKPPPVARRVPRERKDKAPHDEVLLQEFLAKLKLKGNAEIGAAILSWTAQHSEKDALTTRELHELWEQTEHKAPTPASNISRDLAPAIKKGWVKKEGKGKGQTFRAQAYGQKEIAKLMAAPGEQPD